MSKSKISRLTKDFLYLLAAALKNVSAKVSRFSKVTNMSNFVLFVENLYQVNFTIFVSITTSFTPTIPDQKTYFINNE